MIKLQTMGAAVLALSLLTACGTTQSDRMLSGAGIGAGVGAIGGAVVGGNPVAGAAVGAAVGATAGAVIDKRKVNLGRPIWKRN